MKVGGVAGLVSHTSGTTRLRAVAGPNFSGRTTLLRQAVGLANPTQDPEVASSYAYVGPEIYNYLSALATTVRDELLLHSGRDVGDLLEQLQAELLERNPFTLSGGEQALVAILAAVGLCPRVLAIDCALEQIDRNKRDSLLHWLRGALPDGSDVVVADNRLDECPAFDDVEHLGVREDNGSNGLGAHFHPIAAAIAERLPKPPPTELDLEEVAFHYTRSKPVLREVTARLLPGQTYWLAGANGAGKSTLAKILAGAIRPTAGRILCAGRFEEPWRRPGSLVAYHFQNPDLQLFETTVRNELAASAPRRGAQGYWELAAEVFGLQGVLDEHPLDLPFSVRKRVALAATVAMGRPWLVLDEPTLGQDPAASKAIGCTIGRLCNVVGCGIMKRVLPGVARSAMPGRTH